MTGDAFRRLAQALDGVEERSHMGHPDFRVGGRIFASLADEDETLAMVKLSLNDQDRFVEAMPAVFEPCAGAWGRGGATYMRLPKAGAATAKRALKCAYEWVKAKGGSKFRGGRGGGK